MYAAFLLNIMIHRCQTLPSKRWKQKDHIEMSERRGSEFEKQAKPASIRYLLSLPVLRALCISGAGLSFM